MRQHISNLDFTAATYKDVFEAADQCYLSAKQVAVAAVATPLDETLPAFDSQNQPQVAAVNRGGMEARTLEKGTKIIKVTETTKVSQKEGQRDILQTHQKTVVIAITSLLTKLGFVQSHSPAPWSTK